MLPVNEPKYSGNATDFYYAPKEVADIVNLAVRLNRPLLVEGEPGCGKTQLAYSIAKEKGLPPPVKISVKSTSRAKELLYTFNSLRRLQEAQNQGNPDARHLYPYLMLGPLGKLIREKERRVLLIDEVDKADIDFPNDLLDVLQDFTFQIEELPSEEEAACTSKHGFGRDVKQPAGAPRPIIVITSNREKRLPEAFLRRCLYVTLQFPKTSRELSMIVQKNIRPEEARKIEKSLMDAAVAAFEKVREKAMGITQKPPATSELIDWVHILYWTGETPRSIGATPYLPPQWKTLFKTGGDLKAYEEAAQNKSS